MKKFLFVMLAALLVLPMSALGQTSETSTKFLDKCIAEVGVGVGTPNKGYTPLTMSLNLGYNFTPRFYGLQRQRVYWDFMTRMELKPIRRVLPWEEDWASD